jgi:hypothetical protein
MPDVAEQGAGAGGLQGDRMMCCMPTVLDANHLEIRKGAILFGDMQESIHELCLLHVMVTSDVNLLVASRCASLSMY